MTHGTAWTRREITYLCDRINSDGAESVARELGRTVGSVKVKASLMRAFKPRPSREPRPTQYARQIIATIAADTGLHPGDILSKKRNGGLFVARMKVAKALRDRGHSYIKIGHQLGRDHSSILKGLKSIARKGIAL